MIPCGSVRWVRSFMCLSVELEKYPSKNPSTPLRAYCFRLNSGNEKRNVSHPTEVFQRLPRHGRHAYNYSNYRGQSYFWG